MRFWGVLLVLSVFACTNVMAQKMVGKKLVQVKVLDVNEDSVSIKMLGKAPLLLFYQDPDAANQNKVFRDSLKNTRQGDEKIESCVVINFKDCPSLPKFIVRMVAKSEAKSAGAQLCYDMDGTVRRAWELGDVNDKCCIVFVNPEGIVEFYKAGELTATDKKELLALLMKYK